MTTILTRDAISTIAKSVVPSFAGWTASCEAYARAIESAFLEKLCGEPRAWLSWKDGDGYGFWDTKYEAELASAHDFEPEPLYTLKDRQS